MSKEDAIDLYVNYIKQSEISDKELISVFNTLYLYRKPGYQDEINKINTAYIRGQGGLQPIEPGQIVLPKAYRITYNDTTGVGFPTKQVIEHAYTAEDALTQFKVGRETGTYSIRVLAPAPEEETNV